MYVTEFHIPNNTSTETSLRSAHNFLALAHYLILKAVECL